MQIRSAPLLALIILVPSVGFAGGFEIPENTALSVARGGTGAISKRDPSALYFNPALLPRADGLQILFDVNLVGLSVEFQRNPLEVGAPQEFSKASNDAGLFPAPFFAASYDFGIDDLGVAVGVFGPSAYGKRCLTDSSSGDCVNVRDSSARHMMVSSDILEAYFTLGAGYEFDLLGGRLAIGAALALAYQNTNFSVVVDDLLADGVWDEDPNFQGYMKGTDLTQIQPTGLLGLAYEYQGIRVGASYRPPLSWETSGGFEIDLPESLSEIVEVKGDELLFNTEQAGSLRTGVGYEHGTHPGFPSRPLFDVEFNFVWEDWSRLKSFKIEPIAVLDIGGSEQPIHTVYQPKGYQDTFSFRLGGSAGVLKWLTLHAGASYETAAQPEAYTNVDFVSWERIGGGGGASLHLIQWLDLDLGYSYTFSPSREVENGEIYQPIPLSGCQGPDFQSAACENPGTPPGTPQNEGSWSNSFQIFSVGLTALFDL